MKVSIIVPVYNAEKYLIKCIESVIEQSYKNLQIILVNDGSIDASPEICNHYATKDKRIKVIHKENGGVSSARNKGLKEACGKYVMFVDSDDYITSDMVESMVFEIEKYKADIAVCGFTVFSNNNFNNICYEEAFYNNKRQIGNFFSLLNGRTNSPCNKLYKKKLINHYFDERLIIGEDLIFNLDYLKKCNSLVVVSKSLYCYRRENNHSLSRSFNEESFDITMYLHERLINYLFEVSEGNVNSENINIYLLKDTISYFTGLINSTNYKTKDKFTKIKEICKNDILRAAMYDTGSLPHNYRLIRVFIKFKASLLIFSTIKMFAWYKR